MSDHDLMVERLSQNRKDAGEANSRTKDEEELAKWTEAKQELMMRQNRQYLQELLEENATKPIELGAVVVQNGQNFREGFLAHQLKPLLDSQLTNVAGLVKLIDEVAANFQRLGVVEGVYINTGEVRERVLWLSEVPKMVQINPAIYLKPVNRFYAKTGTNVGNGEGDGYIQFQLKNLFGGGELLLFDAITGTKTQLLYLLNYSMPAFSSLRVFLENSIYMNTKQLDWLQTLATVRGMTLKVFTQYDNHNVEVSWENCWRILRNSGASKALDVLLQLGNNYKLSILCNYRYDTRDLSHLPTRGSFFRLGLEYSLLNPSLYFKLVVESLYAHKFLENFSVIATGKTGCVWSLNQLQTTHVLDRFFIGGPNDVRLFALNGLGPRSYKTFIGGDVFVNGGVSLVLRMPWTSTDSGFKLHKFVNFGSLASLDQGSVHGTIQSLKQLSIGSGFGILYNHPVARLELNFVLPLAAHSRDGARKGLQYGIGVSFL